MSNPMEVDSDTPPSQLLRPAFIPTPPAVSSLQDKINLTMNDTNWSNKMKRAGNDPKKRVEVFGFIMIALVHAATSEANFIELASARAAEKLIEGLDEKELKEWEDGVEEGIQNRDWARLASHPVLRKPSPQEKPNLLPHLLPSGLSRDKTRKITPSSEVLEIKALQPLIQKTLDVIRPRIETFLTNPELPDWVPPFTNPSVSEFLTNLRIPAYPNGSPSLLYHNLHAYHDDDVVKKIFGRGNYMFVCNTSGSGKTRRILEGLMTSWGLYFVAARDNNGVGVNDLEAAMDDIARYEDWTEDIRPYIGPDRDNRNKSNIHISNRAIRKVFAARMVVFRLFLQLAEARDGHVGRKHQRLWLLFQLSNPLPGFETPHPFVTMKECLDRASDGALTTLIKDFEQIRLLYFPESKFTIALDEAQQAVRLHRFCFLSSGESSKFRSILREIVRVFSSLVVKIVVSGTGLSLEEVEDALNSSVGKPLGQFETFVELGMFDNSLKLEAILQQYIPSSILESSSGKSLRTRIREYLPGRYRFLISFLELFLRNGLESPHILLNRYIEQYIHCPPGDMDFYEPFTLWEPPLRIQPMIRTFDWERLRESPSGVREVASIVQSHLIKKSTPTFGPLAHKHVEYGIAHLRDDHQGEIIEPLPFLSIVRWLETQKDLCLENNLSHLLADTEYRGHAFEGVVILFLLRTFCRPTVLSTVFKFCGTIPDWADALTQIAGRLQDGVEVPVNVLEIPWRYPSLGVVYYAHTIEDIIRWFKESPAPSVLLPTNLFGPDIIIKCFGGLHLLGQVKSCLEGNINEIDATTTAHALNSLNPTKWFTTMKSQSQRQKLIDTLKEFHILRFLAGFPLPVNLDLAADSVKQALSDLGPVPLATIPLDKFRGKFISPGEVKNVLEPMEHAIARKRGLEMIH